MKTLLLLITFFLFARASPGQTSHHITTDQGLLTNMLTTVIKDRNNYMWIGSYNGLHKHEGSRIKLFKRIGKDSISISGGEMHGLFEDRLGFIWIGTTAGLDKIDPVTGFITHYSIRATDKNSSFVGYIYSVFQDAEDYIWVHTDAAMYRMDYKTGKYKTIPNNKTKDGMPSYATGYKTGISTSKGLWMQTEEGIVYYEYKSHHFFHRYHNPGNKPIFTMSSPALVAGSNSDMTVDADSNMYFIAGASLLGKYDLKTEKLDSFFFEYPPKAWRCCISIATDRNYNVWLGFRHGGLLVFNNRLKTFNPIRFENNNSLISSNYIYSLCEDYTGNMWVTTDKGLDIIDLYDDAVQKKFLSAEPDFTNLVYAAGNLSGDTANGVFIPFFAGGLMRVNAETNDIKHWHLKDSSIKRITYVYHDEKAGLLVAVNKTLFRLSIHNDELSFQKLNTAYATALGKTSGDVVWVYRENEQSVYYKKSNGYIYHYNGTDSLEPIKSTGFKQLACISKDGKYLYYFSPDLNLARRELSTKISVVIPLQEKLKTLDFSFSNPRDIVDDGQGNIWITSQNGLLRYQISSQKLFAYTTQDGLSHSFTFSVCADSKGKVWVGSLGGVDCYNSGTDRFQNVISYSSGTYMDAFGSCLALKNDALFFLAGNNLFRIEADAFLKQKPAPLQLKVNEVMVNGQPVDWQKENPLEHLSYRQNRIQINFSLLDFGYKPNIKYFYYLEGAEKDWIESNRPEVSYNSLPAGRYLFHVKAVYTSGQEIKEQINLPVIIQPPFWQTWWFRIIILLTTAALIYFLFRRWVKAIQTKAVVKQQLAELEAKAIRAQMNPHFIFNSLNAIQECIVTEKVDAAYDYLSRFSKLLRLVLDNSEKNFIPLSSELETIRLYLSLESLRFSQAFTYSIEVEDKLDKEDIYIPSLLLQPFVENAIWHGLINKEGEKKLLLQFNERDGKLECIIEDNGIGREKAAAIKQHKLGAGKLESKGTKLALQRIAILNQQNPGSATIETKDLFDNNGNATGTSVLITLSSHLSSKTIVSHD